MLDRTTPVILSFNEEANIERVLERLYWADSIVLVDSFSTDRTLEIASNYATVRVVQRRFDSHAQQWNFAIHETGIQTDWILALDADYVLTRELIDELSVLNPQAEVSGYRVSFQYCIFGKPLRGTLYPPVTALFRKNGARYVQDGHTQRVVVSGKVVALHSTIFHDDRKPLSAWLQAQNRYMSLEAKIIHRASWKELGWADKMRKMIIAAPVFVFVYCFLIKLGIVDGWRGLYYALQRTAAEIILSLKLLEAVHVEDGKKG